MAGALAIMRASSTTILRLGDSRGGKRGSDCSAESTHAQTPTAATGTAATAHLDEARRFGNEGRRRRAIVRAIDLEPVIMELRESGQSLRGIAAELNRLGIRQSRGGVNWTPNAVRNALRWSEPLFPARKKWNKFAQRFE
jgi:hypothetical protein